MTEVEPVSPQLAWYRRNRERFNERKRAGKNWHNGNRARSKGEWVWLGLDGEGWGVDELGRQCYTMMAAADDRSGFESVLYPRGERLTTAEALEWICWLEPNFKRHCQAQELTFRPRLCGFGLGYDFAHILLDLSLEQLQALFHQGGFNQPWVEFDANDTTYKLKLIGGSLRVMRVKDGRRLGGAIIWDVIRYFQSSFLAAAEQVMSPEERVLVEAGKQRRGDDEHDLEEESRYTLAECRILARLMASVEQQAQGLDLHPSSWFGPGSLANLALHKQGVGAHFKPDSDRSEDFQAALQIAFVGGRFETTGHGRQSSLTQYDINSAYPFAITDLPCLAHTRWEKVDGGSEVPVDRHGLYHLRWNHHGRAPAGGWGPWPSRVVPASGLLDQELKFLPSWPWKGEGWVWGVEMLAGAELLKHSPWVTVELVEAWLPVRRCDCRPFRWVWEWFDRRRQLKYEGDPRERWLKLILNSLYGKMAQRVGKPRWHSWIWAGYVTAHCRAGLLRAIAGEPESIVMTATDSVYSVRGLAHLDLGEGLGQWDVQWLQNVLVVQSGFLDAANYEKHKPRTRGVPARYIDWAAFHQLWDSILAGREPWENSGVTIEKDVATGEPFQVHVGIGLAQSWNAPEKLGAWVDFPTTVGFQTDKRPLAWKRSARDTPEGWFWTKPLTWPGKRFDEPAAYRPGKGIGEDRLLVADQPHSVEWGASEA